MPRLKESNFYSDSEVARLVTEMCNRTDKTQVQIAQEAGFEKTNIITMLKSGRTKFPLSRIVQFSRACEYNPEILLDACMKEYYPDLSDILLSIKGRILSKGEKAIIASLRQVKNDLDQQKGRHRWASEEKINLWSQKCAPEILELVD